MSVSEDNKMLLLLTYVLFPLGSLFIFFTDKKNDPTCKFHAWQALLLWVVQIVSTVVIIGPLIVWLYSCFYGYKLFSSGEEMTIPMLTDFAQQQSKK